MPTQALPMDTQGLPPELMAQLMQGGGEMPQEMGGYPQEQMMSGMEEIPEEQYGYEEQAPEDDMAGALPINQGGTSPSTPAGIEGKNLEEITQNFEQIMQEAPQVAEAAAQAAQEAGLTGKILEEIGYFIAFILAYPDEYKTIRKMIIKRYPEEAELFPDKLEEAEEQLYNILFAAFLQEGGLI